MSVPNCHNFNFQKSYVSSFILLTLRENCKKKRLNNRNYAINSKYQVVFVYVKMLQILARNIFVNKNTNLSVAIATNGDTEITQSRVNNGAEQTMYTNGVWVKY